MYSMYNEGKSAITERFIRTLKNKIYKYMTSVSKNIYIDKLDDIVNKYNNTYHSTIQMKRADVKSNTYIESSQKINDKNPKFKLVILWEYQNIETFLQKVTLEIGLKKSLWLKKLKIVFRGLMLLVILKVKKLREFRTEKLTRRKVDKLYVKWKGFSNSFNSWIDKKDIV